MIRVVAADDAVAALTEACRSGDHVLVTDRPGDLDRTIVDRMSALVDQELVGTVSPVPLPGVPEPVAYDVHAACPPAPSLPTLCPRLCVLSAHALAASSPTTGAGATLRAELEGLAEQLLASGWRHVACPGVTMTWDPALPEHLRSVAGWSARSAASLAGAANTGLEAHRSWAAARTAPVHVVVDGACMTTRPYTGTQHLVLEISRWLSRARPRDRVSLAVRADAIAPIRDELSGEEVAVVERTPGVDADVMYRPYQMLFARELDFVESVGRRRLVGQLDMIGFSNPFYHPSDRLFFFARNLQRYMMRTLDGVTFISDFGRRSAYAECPDLDRRRLHVVSCGADPVARSGSLRPGREIDAGTPYLVALASTFWHKNRTHAIATFAELVASERYEGHLVIAGPEPYYGRSTEAEQASIDTLPRDVAARVHRWGNVGEDEKWWLLSHADATLYPSIVEGFGLVPFESAVAGTPCLAFSGSAPGELLAGTGAIIDTWCAERWAGVLATWLGDPAASRAVVDQVRDVAARHTWRACAELTWEAIDATLAAPRRVPADDDGDRLTRIAGRPRPAIAGSARFAAARVVPAVRRRARLVLARRSTNGAAR